MPETHSVYVSIKLDVVIPDTLPEGFEDADEVIDHVVSEMKYSLTYDEEGVKIADTEVIGHQPHAPIGM